MSTAQQVFDDAVRQLPAMEKLRLASMILELLTSQGQNARDLSDSWSDEDIRDLTAFSLRHSKASEDAKQERDA